MPRRRSTVLLARGDTPRAALRALALEVDAILPDLADPEVVFVVQARASHDGSGFVAEAAIWNMRRYSEVPPAVEPRPSSVPPPTKKGP